MEPIRRYETPLGAVEIRGRDTGRPVQLVITGAFAIERQLVHNQVRFPDLDVWRMHMPGNHAPELQAISVGAFAFAFSHALREALGGRRAQVVGLSLGGLVALALDQDLVDRYVLTDPPIVPAWPLKDLVQAAPPSGQPLVWQMFGYAPDRSEPRDYTGLLDRLRRPAVVIVGDVPLEPPRALPVVPSLVDLETLARMRAHPLIEVDVFEGCGHQVLEPPERFFAVLRRTLPA